MAVNLSRNTKVYFSTAQTPALATCQELQILDGFSFSQSVDAATIQVSEAGSSPVRGQRSFNNKLNPVEWSFSTYVRPNKSTNVTAPEKLLWNALLGAQAIDGTGVAFTAASTTAPSGAQTTYLATVTVASHNFSIGEAIRVVGLTGGLTELNGSWTVTATTATTITFDLDTTVAPTAGTPVYTTAKVYRGQWYETTTSAVASTVGSNVNQLQDFYLFFVVDNTTYRLDKCALNQAELSFDLTGIATIAWSGMATTLTEVAANTINPGTNATAFSLSATSDTFITNKLSTIVLKSTIGGNGTGNKTYTVPITGGTFTYSNNIEYVTPDTLSAVDAPIGYFTGTRSVSGNLTAYLKTGTNESSTLLSDMLTAAATTVEPKYYLEVSVGGKTNTTRVELLMNGVSLQIPSVDVQDVVSTTINFNAQGHFNHATAGGFDLANANDLLVSYYHA